MHENHTRQSRVRGETSVTPLLLAQPSPKGEGRGNETDPFSG